MNLLNHHARLINSEILSGQGSPFIQPKLTINNPNDPYEKEADTVADKVMQMQNLPIQTKADNNSFFKPASADTSSVQRKCAHCEEEEKQMQRKEINGEETTADESLENYVGNLSSGWQPLPNAVRNFYEPRFGYDFSNVKLHTDAVAAKSAQSINALAYTSGNNIVFNNGQYSPDTDSGKRLLGHELTHVVQQQSAPEKTIKRKDGACPAMTKVVVDMISFRGTDRIPSTDLVKTNAIFAPCCIEFVMGRGVSVSPDFSDPRMGNDTTFDRGRCGEDTAEEQALIPAVNKKFNLNGRIHVFYFENINPDAKATSQPEYCSTPLALNHVYMTNSAVDRTMAHEIGHILLNDLLHDSPPDNLMHPSEGSLGSNLTPEQCATIKTNI